MSQAPQLLVVIQTLARPRELQRSLESMSGWDTTAAAFVVDDGNAEQRNETRRILETFDDPRPVHVTVDSSRALFEAVGKATRIPATRVAETTGLLGQNGWNAPASRNIALLLAVVHAGRSVLLLDDDIDVRVSPPAAIDADEAIYMVPFRGRPDLDDAGWIALAAYAASGGIVSSCRGRGALTLAESMSPIEARELVSRETDLLGAPYGGNELRPPVPTFKSGAALLLRQTRKAVPLVPVGCDEDLQWLRRCRQEGWRLDDAKQSGIHRPQKRRRVTIATLVASEFGAAASSLCRLTRSGWRGDLEHALGVFLARRVASLLDLERRVCRLVHLAALVNDAARDLSTVSRTARAQACASARRYVARTQTWEHLQNALLERKDYGLGQEIGDQMR